jgi:transcriptional regulator
MLDYTDEDSIFEHIALNDAVAVMPPKQKVVLAMISAGHTQLDCARVIGLTRAAIGAIYHKAIEEIREAMDGSS